MELVLDLATLSPWLAVLVLGALIALLTLRRHPRVSALALVCYGGLAVFSTLMVVSWHLAPAAWMQALPDWAWTIVAMVESTIEGVFIVGMGGAMLIGRFADPEEAP